ncbi:MAG: phage baseplate assembly protein V [Burkholderiales bacterium]|nr:phage baseplate assembly protein V [Burkholderiales bacterium]
MISALVNRMREEAQRSDGKMMSRAGIVTAYNPNTYSVKVDLKPTAGQPPQLETDWLPVASHWTGNGWGMFSPPTIGDQVNVLFLEGDVDTGYVVQHFFDQQHAPLAVPSGEYWLVHKSGTFQKLVNTGDMDINTNAALNVTVGSNATININGNATVTVGGSANVSVSGTITSSAQQWNHSGPMKVAGTLQVTQTITGQGGLALSGAPGGSGAAAQISGSLTTTGNVTAGSIDLQGHVHGGVQSGSNTTGGPQG